MAEMENSYSGAPSAVQGSVCAALVSAGLGCFVLGLTDVLADASQAMNKAFNIYNPTGALSGETTLAVVLWLVSWFVLERMWTARAPKLGAALGAALAMLLLGLALTFPPIVDVLTGH
ncbi:hypothetical protein SAMN05421819_3721 [Bryocella elongata]|uniref:Uncharacterized protein n=1 Tax=Bryocella elongata TaxID=863522 RepID=A0A1H6BIX7_9BACT|nr:hypothetical protein [Bryocella elongata]SEG60335.1 hypothetical protein SAMN05421819_3721 [Bryocella elongata]